MLKILLLIDHYYGERKAIEINGQVWLRQRPVINSNGIYFIWVYLGDINSLSDYIKEKLRL